MSNATELSEIWSFFTYPSCLRISLQEWPLSWPWPHSVSAPGTLFLKWPMPQPWTGSLLSAMLLSSRPSLSLPQSTTSPRGVTPGMEKVWCQRRYLKPCFTLLLLLRDRHKQKLDIADDFINCPHFFSYSVKSLPLFLPNKIPNAFWQNYSKSVYLGREKNIIRPDTSYQNCNSRNYIHGLLFQRGIHRDSKHLTVEGARPGREHFVVVATSSHRKRNLSNMTWTLIV